MKLFFSILFLLTFENICYSQTTYTFQGSGNWTDQSNWSNAIIPPNILPKGDTIIISSAAEGSCILNTTQIILTGSSLIVSPNASFIIQGTLTLHDSITDRTCTQNWMTKNLDVATYRNGDPIPKVEDNTTWSTLTTGAYCYFMNDSAKYAALYGKLYNWYAVSDPRGLAPIGWHIPTLEEWTTLVNCVGGHQLLELQ